MVSPAFKAIPGARVVAFRRLYAIGDEPIPVGSVGVISAAFIGGGFMARFGARLSACSWLDVCPVPAGLLPMIAGTAEEARSLFVADLAECLREAIAGMGSAIVTVDCRARGRGEALGDLLARWAGLTLIEPSIERAAAEPRADNGRQILRHTAVWELLRRARTMLVAAREDWKENPDRRLEVGRLLADISAKASEEEIVAIPDGDGERADLIRRLDLVLRETSRRGAGLATPEAHARAIRDAIVALAAPIARIDGEFSLALRWAERVHADPDAPAEERAAAIALLSLSLRGAEEAPAPGPALMRLKLWESNFPAWIEIDPRAIVSFEVSGASSWETVTLRLRGGHVAKIDPGHLASISALHAWAAREARRPASPTVDSLAFDAWATKVRGIPGWQERASSTDALVRHYAAGRTPLEAFTLETKPF